MAEQHESTMPRFYRAPLGLPFYWRDEESGQLRKAVESYLDNRLHGTTITDEQIGLVRDYIVHYIDAPCWNTEDPELQSDLKNLRTSARELDSATEIGEWIFKALDLGLDPL